jgi:hypothetical protein
MVFRALIAKGSEQKNATVIRKLATSNGVKTINPFFMRI